MNDVKMKRGKSILVHSGTFALLSTVSARLLLRVIVLQENKSSPKPQLSRIRFSSRSSLYFAVFIFALHLYRLCRACCQEASLCAVWSPLNIASSLTAKKSHFGLIRMTNLLPVYLGVSNVPVCKLQSRFKMIFESSTSE